MKRIFGRSRHRHVSGYFEFGGPEVNAFNQLLADCRTEIQRIDRLVLGFNVGINDSEDAGQTVLHCHIHLIPRRAGDVESPKGGVRHVIPGKGLD